MSGRMGSVARARMGRDHRGRLCVFGSARTPDGQRLRKRLVVPARSASTRGGPRHDRQQVQSKRITFRPLVAAELERLLEVLRCPRDATERMWFPLTELLVLTGLRWGEGAGLRWREVEGSGTARRRGTPWTPTGCHGASARGSNFGSERN